MKLRHLDRKEDGGTRSLKIEQQKRKYKAQSMETESVEDKIISTIPLNKSKEVKEQKQTSLKLWKRFKVSLGVH